MIKRNDIILVGIILVLCVGIFAFIFMTKEDGSKVVVTIDGNEYKTFDLNTDTTFTVPGDDGQFNTFTIKDGIVDMTDASCPDLLCVHQNSIHYNHETIVCLPNKVVLEIISNNDSDVDIIAK